MVGMNVSKWRAEDQSRALPRRERSIRFERCARLLSLAPPRDVARRWRVAEVFDRRRVNDFLSICGPVLVFEIRRRAWDRNFNPVLLRFVDIRRCVVAGVLGSSNYAHNCQIGAFLWLLWFVFQLENWPACLVLTARKLDRASKCKGKTMEVVRP